MENKTRLYTPNQESLETIKKWLKENNFKSNNSTAVYEAVDMLAEMINSKQK